MKIDHTQIRTTVEHLKTNYNFKGPLHFTDFSNLASLKNLGSIYSRNFCKNQNIEFYDVADSGVIDNTGIDVQNCARFYYKEKTMTLYKNEGIKTDGSNPHVPIPVYLLFDEAIIYLDYTIFANGNAGSRYTDYGKDFSFFNDNMDWDTIFHRGPIYFDEGPEKWEFKRKRQAELLSSQPISLDYLRKIIFRCDADFKRACNLFGNSDLFFVDRNMFNNERNYIKDYNINIQNEINSRSLFIKITSNLAVVKNAELSYKLLDKMNNEIFSQNITFRESHGTKFTLKIKNIPSSSFKLEIWYYGYLSIEEQIK